MTTDNDPQSDLHEMERGMAAYHAERRDLLITTIVPMCLLSFGLIGGAIYAVEHYSGVALLGDFAWLKVLALCIALAVPPLWMMLPEKPTLDGLRYDKLLNQIGELARQRRLASRTTPTSLDLRS